MSEDMSFKLTIIMFVIGIVRTLVSWMITSHCGRSNIYFYGLCCMSVLLLLIGGLGCSSQKNASWGVGGLLIVFAFAYNSSLGPLVYCIVTELPSSRLRAKTVIIARNLYNIAGIVVQVITPYMLNPTAWNWKAKSGFLWAGVCIIGLCGHFLIYPRRKAELLPNWIYFLKKKSHQGIFS